MSAHYKALTRRTQPDEIAVFPLNGTVMLPCCDLPLNIFEPRYLNMIDDALKSNRLIGMIQTDKASETGLAKIGGLGRIVQFSETDDGRYLIVLKGLKRFSFVKDAEATTPYRRAVVDFANFEQDADLHDPMPVPKAFKNLGGERATLTVAMKALAKTLNVNVDWDSLADIPLDQLVDQAAMISPFKSEDKQSLLEAGSGEERRRLLTGLMHLYAANGSGENPRPTN